jgi:hypothetical protein
MNNQLVKNSDIISKLFKEEKLNPIDLRRGTYRVTNRYPYESIDLIEYHKSGIEQNKLGRGIQTLKGTKIIFQHLFQFDIPLLLSH